MVRQNPTRGDDEMPMTLETQLEGPKQVWIQKLTEDGTYAGIGEAEAFGLGFRARFYDHHHDTAASHLQLNEDGWFYCSNLDIANWAALLVAEAAEATRIR
jgi:hypothetical protein